MIERLKSFREEAMLKQDEAAFFSGVALATLQGWEQGKHIPRVTDLRPLADIYGRSTSDFLVEKPGPPDFRSIAAFRLMVHPAADVEPILRAKAEGAIAQMNDLYVRRASKSKASNDPHKAPGQG